MSFCCNRDLHVASPAVNHLIFGRVRKRS